jgi:ABC-2 type transport system permease protein
MKWYRIKGLILNYYYFSINSLDRIFDVFYWPILDLMIWGFMTFFINGISEFNVLNTILGGVILWVFVWRASTDLVVYLLEGYWSRSIYHLFSTPIKNSELIVSLFILGVIRSFMAFGVMLLLSIGIYNFNILLFNPLHLLLIIPMLLLFAWSVGLFVSSFIFRYGSRLQVLAWSAIWIIQPFSCVFYPLSALPPWAAKIAVLIPTTHMFEQLRATMAGGSFNFMGLLYSGIGIVILLTISSFMVVRAIAAAKKSGQLAKPE